VNTTILVKFLVDVGVWICDLCLPRLSIILLLLLTLGQIWFDPLNHSLDFLIFLGTNMLIFELRQDPGSINIDVTTASLAVEPNETRG